MSEDAVERRIAQIRPRVRRIVHRMCPRWSEREDWEQECLIRISGALLAVPEAPDGYLVRVCINRCNDLLRESHPSRSPKPCALDDADSVPVGVAVLEGSRLELEDDVRNAIGFARAAGGQEFVLVATMLAYEMTMEEIAYVLGCKPSSLTRRVSRYRAKVRIALSSGAEVAPADARSSPT